MSKPKSRTSKRPASGGGGGLEDLFGNLGNLGPIAQIFMQGFQTFAGPHKHVFDQLSQFATHFSRNAVQKWTRAGVPRGTQCVMEGCEGEAVLTCMSCGQPACLAHIHLSHRAEGVCDGCVRELLKLKGKTWGADGQQGGANPREPSGAEIRAAHRKLGVGMDVGWDKVRAAHRFMAAKYHPDRAKNEVERQKSEKVSKEINAAFEMLKSYYEKNGKAAA
jgi:hypothetical protein